MNKINLFYVQEIVLLSSEDLSKKSGLDLQTCHLLLQKCYELLTPKISTGLESLKKQEFLSTGDPEIDELLNGGLLTAHVTEVYGESSCKILLFYILLIHLFYKI